MPSKRRRSCSGTRHPAAEHLRAVAESTKKRAAAASRSARLGARTTIQYERRLWGSMSQDIRWTSMPSSGSGLLRRHPICQRERRRHAGDPLRNPQHHQGNDTKKGDRMAFLALEDKGGIMEVVLLRTPLPRPGHCSKAMNPGRHRPPAQDEKGSKVRASAF